MAGLNLGVGGGVKFEPSGECRSSNCDNCQRFFQPIPNSTGTCVCGHNYAFHAALPPTQVLPFTPTPSITSAFTHAPGFDRFQMARDACLPPPTSTTAAPINSLYARVPTPLSANSPYAPAPGAGISGPGLPSAASELSVPNSEFSAARGTASLTDIREPTIQGVEASLRMGTPYSRRLGEMTRASSSGRGGRGGRGRNTRMPAVREFCATFTYLRQPYERGIPNGMSAEHKRLESRGLCNIPVTFDLDQDTSEGAVRRIITGALQTRNLGSRADDWKLWRIESTRGVGSLGPLPGNVVLDLATVQFCCRGNSKNNFYITPKYDLFTLAELHNLAEWFTNYTTRAESARCWADWQVIDEREREQFLEEMGDIPALDGEGHIPSVRTTRSRAQMEEGAEETYLPLPPRRRPRGVSTQTTGYRRRGRPPRVVGPTIRVSEEPESPIPEPEFPIPEPESPAPESVPSPAPSLSITEPATPEPEAPEPEAPEHTSPSNCNIPESRRSQLADPNSDIRRFEGILSKMLDIHGPKVRTREEDRTAWGFRDDPSVWLDRLFDYINRTPWELRTTNPHPRVNVYHRYYRRGVDCGGVFKTFVDKNIKDFVGGEDFVDGGFLGRIFRQDFQSEASSPSGFEPLPPHFRRYEMFGKLMASYMFCHRDFPWPRGLDPAVFLVAYSRFRGVRYAPHSSRIPGPIGWAMKVLEEYKEGFPSASTRNVPQVLYDATDTICWPREVVQNNLQDLGRIELMRTSLYWKTHWKMREGGLDAFIRGLNERNLFQVMAEDDTLQLEDLDSWLLQSGIPSSESVGAALKFSAGNRAEDRGPEFRERFQRVKSLFEGWVELSGRDGNLEGLDWLVQEVFGTSFVGSNSISIVITTRIGGYREGVMHFSTCLNELKLSTQLLREYGTPESFSELMEMHRVSCTGGVEFSRS